MGYEGIVDKFQGHAVAVCFFSMATSSGEEIARNLEFLFSRNRLNVAVSRARCLSCAGLLPGVAGDSVSERGADAAVERALLVCGDGWGRRKLLITPGRTVDYLQQSDERFRANFHCAEPKIGAFA